MIPGEDGTVRMWEVDSGLCRVSWQLKLGPVTAVTWNCSPDVLQQHLLAVSAGKSLVLIATGTGDVDATQVTESQLEEAEKSARSGHVEVEEEEEIVEEAEDEEKEIKKKKVASMKWKVCEREEKGQVRFGSVVGPRVRLDFESNLLSVQWHYKGDYLVTLTEGDGRDAVAVHQVRSLYILR